MKGPLLPPTMPVLCPGSCVQAVVGNINMSVGVAIMHNEHRGQGGRAARAGFVEAGGKAIDFNSHRTCGPISSCPKVRSHRGKASSGRQHLLEESRGLLLLARAWASTPATRGIPPPSISLVSVPAMPGQYAHPGPHKASHDAHRLQFPEPSILGAPGAWPRGAVPGAMS